LNQNQSNYTFFAVDNFLYSNYILTIEYH